MTHFTTNLPGFLASVMLVIQPSVCLCSESLDSPAAGHAPRCCDTRAVFDEGASHHNHSGSPRRPTCEGDACPCLGQCKSHDSQATVPARAATRDTLERDVVAYLAKGWILTLFQATNEDGMGHHASLSESVMQAALTSVGNSCALLSRWLC